MATFSNEEYANIHYIYGYCDGNEEAAVKEYQWQFPEHRVPDQQIFSSVHQNLKESGKFPQPRHDTVSVWRTTYLKWLSTVQLRASEGYMIEFILARCKFGEPFTTLVCTPRTCKLPRFYNQLITLHV
jgi:hypothetical protein